MSIFADAYCSADALHKMYSTKMQKSEIKTIDIETIPLVDQGNQPTKSPKESKREEDFIILKRKKRRLRLGKGWGQLCSGVG